MSYLILFGWSFLAATLIPLGSEPAVILLVRQGDPVALVVTIATIGNYLGACTTYWIGRRVVPAVALEGIPASPASRATRLFARYGSPTLLLSWFPVIGDALVAAAGAARIPFATFSLWTIAGKLSRYVVVAWSAARLTS